MKVFAYGGIKLIKLYCDYCDDYYLAACFDSQCTCGKVGSYGNNKLTITRVCDEGRKRPSERHQKQLLEKQDNCCAYCGRKFGDMFMRNGKVKTLKLAWDHISPFVVTMNNEDDNFCAACTLCNSFKHSRVFKTIDEIKAFCIGKWDNKILSKEIEFPT